MKTKEQELALAIDLRHLFREFLETAIKNRDAGLIVAYSVESNKLRDIVIQLEKEIAA